MKYVLIYAWIVLSPLSTVGGIEALLFDTQRQKGGWKGFGSGFDDIILYQKRNEIIVATSWERCTWGVGVLYVLDQPRGTKTVEKLSFKVKDLTSLFLTCYKSAGSMQLLRRVGKRANAGADHRRDRPGFFPDFPDNRDSDIDESGI